VLRVDARDRDAGGEAVALQELHEARVRQHVDRAARQDAAGHEPEPDQRGRCAVVRRTERDEALRAAVAAVVLDVVARDEPALRVSDDVEALEAVAPAHALDLRRDRRCELADGARVEPREEPAEIEAEHTEAVVAEAVLHHFPDVPRLEEAVQEEHGLLVVGEIPAAHDPVRAQVDLPDAPELIPGQVIRARGREPTGHASK